MLTFIVVGYLIVEVHVQYSMFNVQYSMFNVDRIPLFPLRNPQFTKSLFYSFLFYKIGDFNAKKKNI